MVDITARILGFTLDPPILNASGVFSYLPVLRRLQGHFGAVVTKSIGYMEREGFENPVFAQLDERTHINAVGLPNPGYRAMLEEMLEHYPLRKPLVVSVFGSSVSEIREMVRELGCACDAFEVNLSCPHPQPGEKVGKALGSDPEAAQGFVSAVKSSTSKPVIAKLSYSIEGLERTVEACLDGGADGISATNTVGPTDSSNPRTKWPVLSNVHGGVSGKAILGKGLETVKRIRDVDGEVPLIGMGGISSGRDIVEYVKAGADAVAVGTAFDLMSTRKVGEFMDQLVRDLGEAVRKEGANSLKELRK